MSSESGLTDSPSSNVSVLPIEFVNQYDQRPPFLPPQDDVPTPFREEFLSSPAPIDMPIPWHMQALQLGTADTMAEVLADLAPLAVQLHDRPLAPSKRDRILDHQGTINLFDRLCTK